MNIVLSFPLFAQDCPSFNSISITDALCLGGQFEFNAQAEGGIGSCSLILEIKPENADDSQFLFIASVSNGPGKTLSGFTTLIAGNYPVGKYVVRFSYDCDADECPVLEERLELNIYPDQEDIVDAEITPFICLGGRLEFNALAICGTGDCSLRLDIKPVAAPDTEFKFIASISGGDSRKKLLGSITPSAAIYPAGLYEARFLYSCTESEEVEKRLVFEITPDPFISSANVSNSICEGEEIEFEAEGVGGAGNCGFTLQIKSAGQTDAEFIDLGTYPGNSVLNTLILPSQDYPAGDYEVRLLFDCDGSSCEEDEARFDLTISVEPSIGEFDVSTSICEGGILDYFSMAVCQGDDCTYTLQIKLKNDPDESFSDLVTSSDEVLSGNIVLDAGSFPSGNYELRVVFDCVDDAFGPQEKRTDLTIYDEPAIGVVEVSAEICEGGELIYYAEGTCGTTNCSMTVSVKDENSVSYQVIENVAGDVISGFTNLDPVDFPPGNYDVLFTYDCDEFMSAIEKSAGFSILPSPKITNAGVDVDFEFSCEILKLDYFAEGTGGSGSCFLNMEIKPANAPDSEFVLLDGTSNGPGQSLNGTVDIEYADYPAGQYEVRFLYDCDGNDCNSDERRFIIDVYPLPSILTVESTRNICEGGRLEFSATAVGGTGSCTLQLFIKPINSPDSEFKFIASVSNGPGKSLNGSTTLNSINFPAGEYELRFLYDCDGDGCGAAETRLPFTVFNEMEIIDYRVTREVCLGGRMDFFAEALCGSGNCKLQIEIKPKLSDDSEFKFLASVSNGPGKKLVGSTTLSEQNYPIGNYEVRFIYTCDDGGEIDMIEERIDVNVIPNPELIDNPQLTYDICSREDFPILLDDLINPEPGYSLVFEDENGNEVENLFSINIENKGNQPIDTTISFTPSFCPSCPTAIRIGGQEGDNFIGPTCNNDGTYRTCYYLTGIGLPSEPSRYSAIINGKELSVEFLSITGPDEQVICFTGIVPDEDFLADLTLFFDGKICFELVDFYPEVDCADPCPTEIRIGGLQGDNFIGPLCNGDGTYRTTFYISGVEILASDISRYTVIINGISYVPTFFASLNSFEKVIGITGIVADEDLLADVILLVNDEPCLELEALYMEPECGPCPDIARVGGQPGDSYIGPTCNNDGTYRIAFYLNGGSTLANDISRYTATINGNNYLPVFFISSGPGAVVLGFTGITNDLHNIADVSFYVDGELCLEYTDFYMEPVCPLPISVNNGDLENIGIEFTMNQDESGNSDGSSDDINSNIFQRPSSNAQVINNIEITKLKLEDFQVTKNLSGEVQYAEHNDGFCCTGESFELTFTIYPEPVGADDVKEIETCYPVDYDLQANIDMFGNMLESNFNWYSVESIGTDIPYDNPDIEGESINPKGEGDVIDDVLTNTTDQSQFIIYRIEPVSEFIPNDSEQTTGCIGDPFYLTVTINSRPDISACIGCDNQINISFGDVCEVDISLEMVAQGDILNCENGDLLIEALEVIVYDNMYPNGEPDNLVNKPGIFNYSIELKPEYKWCFIWTPCWGKVLVEDKIGPAFPEMFSQEDPCAYRCTDFNTETRLIDGVAILTESDLTDCSGVTLFGPYLVFKSAEECSAPDTVIYHYTAKDDNGYTSEKDYYYTIEQLSIGKFEFPDDYEGSCSAAGANLSPSAINSYPLYDGMPADFLIFDTENTARACNIVVNYMDIKQITTCGDAAGCALNRKVIREWTIIDWCAVDDGSQEAIRMETQMLDLKDTEAPTINGPEEMTISTDPWKCAAEFEIVIDAEDNCATDDALTYVLLGPVGVSIEGDGHVFTIKHAPPTYEEPHTFTAYATDCCDNISEAFEIEVWIRDEAKPFAVAKEFTVASITNVAGEEGDIVKVYWQSIDNGSWDACSDLEYYVRRMDGDPHDCDTKDFFPYDYDDEKYTITEAIEFYYDEVECRTAEIQDDFVIPLKLEGPNIDDKYDYGSELCNTGLIPYNGDEWGEYAKFCCADLDSNADDADIDGDGLKNEHRVELIVFDQAGNWNITWGWVKVEDPNPPILEIEPYETYCHDEILSGSYADMLENIKIEAKKLVTATGACEIDLSELVVQGELNDECWDPTCKFGSGTIAYSITSPKGGIVRGTQEYTIYYKDDFACDDIHGWTYDLDDPWYDDADNYDFRDNLDADCMSPVPENLTWDAGPCALIGWNMVSDTFQFETDACVKVINTWTVIDWCVYEYTKEESKEKDAQKLYGHWYEFQQYGPGVMREDELRPMEGSNRSCDSYYHLDHDGDLDYIDERVEKPHWFSGVYTWTQVIKVTDEIAPEIVPFEDDMLTDSILVSCAQGITVELTAEDTGDCAAVWFKWSLSEIDTFGGIATDDNYPQKSGTTVVYNLGEFAGPKESKYYRAQAWDGCGNTDTYDFKYSLVDAKAPTPYCINLSTALMVDPDGEEGELVAMVELWACDFDLGSFDNCTDEEDLYFTFDGVAPGIGKVGDDELTEKEQYYSENGLLTYDRDESTNTSNWRNPSGGAMNADRLSEIRLAYLTGEEFEGAEVYRWLPSDQSDCGKYTAGKVFTEAELRGGDTDGDGNVDVQMDVWDECLNEDYCSVQLTLRCETCPLDGAVATVAGVVATEAGKEVSDVDVTLMNLNNPENVLNQKTGTDGGYAFVGNPMYQDYDISGFKAEAADEGVSTLDLVMIQRHILGLTPFESPYKVIASDINNNGSLNATDLIVLRKVILGIYAEFPDNTSWKFVDASKALEVETVLSEYTETIEIKDLDANRMAEDFVAIKVGDVNGDARTNAREAGPKVRNANKVSMTIEDRYVEKGEVVEIVFGSAEFAEVYGFQFTLEFAGLHFNAITAGEANLGMSNLRMVDDRTMVVSYDDNNGLRASDDLFKLTMEATASGTLGEMIEITGNALSSEAYIGTGLEVMTLELTVEDPLVADFHLQQNEPNPFDQVTYIGFTLPEGGKAELTIHDVAGKMITRIAGEFAKGSNEMRIDKRRLGASGVYYYTLKSGEFSATKKMILIE